MSVSSVYSNQSETELTVKEHLPAVDHIDQGRMEGKDKVSTNSVYSNRRETELTVGRALTRFIAGHIVQGSMEGRGN